MCGVPITPSPPWDGWSAGLPRRPLRADGGSRTAKGVVKREVVRVVTPGTQLESSALDATEAAFVLALAPGPSSLGAAWIDATTGEFEVAEWEGALPGTRLRDDSRGHAPARAARAAWPPCPAWLTDATRPKARSRARSWIRRVRPAAASRLLSHFGVLTLEASGATPPRRRRRRGRRLALPARHAEARPRPRDGACARAPRTTASSSAADPPQPGLVDNAVDGSRRGTLLDVLDSTRTPMGRAGCTPMAAASAGRAGADPGPAGRGRRLAFRTVERARLREVLATSRTSTASWEGSAWASSLRDLRAAVPLPARVAGGRGLGQECQAPLRAVRNAGPRSPLDVAEDIRRRWWTSRRPPLREGGVVRAGVDAELDSLRRSATAGAPPSPPSRSGRSPPASRT